MASVEWLRVHVGHDVRQMPGTAVVSRCGDGENNMERNKSRTVCALIPPSTNFHDAGSRPMFPET